jgi:methylenetetrahydrofolate reductase (NADPH)
MTNTKSTSTDRISIELVPRSLESLDADLQTLRERFSSIGMVNIPDLLRFDVRSWDACRVARRSLPRAIPHVRAMDFPRKAAGRLAEILGERGHEEVLIVRGDPPQDMRRTVHPTSSAELIHALKEVAPQIRAYAALDPYRGGVIDELSGLRDKLEAGAVGFFSQPIFDLRFMDLWRDQLPGVEVFWGVSPVVSAASRRYWEVKNRAFFPASFEPTLDWNRAFARTCLAWATEHDQPLYFMPIRVPLEAYLDGLF